MRASLGQGGGYYDRLLAALAAHAYRGCVLDLVLGDDTATLHDALASRELPVLLVSGRDPASLERVASPRGWTFAAKPVAPQVLRDLVGDLLGVEVAEPTQRGVRVQASTPAPVTRSVPGTPPVAVQLIDRLGDIVGVIALSALCYAGKLSGEAAYQGLADAGVMTRWLTGQGQGPGLRITIGTAEQMDRIAGELRKLAEAAP